MKKILISFTLIFISSFSFSQGEINDGNRIYYRNEKCFGITLNSNGYGVGYRYGKRINARKKWLFEGNLNIVKHKKERKDFNPYSTSLSRFAYGKKNFAFNLNFAVGRQKELYQKFDKNSVSIRFFYELGATGAFLKPIYYNVLIGVPGSSEIEEKKFDESISSPISIWGKAPFYKGIGEMKVLPGAFAKAGFSFEFSKKDHRLTILEVGATFEIYPKKIEIMATEDNSFYFPVVYISFRFGKVVSGYHLKEVDEGTE